MHNRHTTGLKITQHKFCVYTYSVQLLPDTSFLAAALHTCMLLGRRKVLRDSNKVKKQSLFESWLREKVVINQS